MPIYEYVCSACDHRADIFHGLHDPGPHYCPSCGREGTMRKAIATPTIIYKGSGWAKKDRRATSSPRSSADHRSGGVDKKGDASAGDSTTARDSSTADAGDSAKGDASKGDSKAGSDTAASTAKGGGD